jgi:ATP-dependent DNA helicase RecG
LQKILPLKSKRLITGKLERFQDKWKIVHPDTVTSPEDASYFTGSEPVYPLATGITNKCMARVLKSALAHVRALPEWLDEEKSRLWPTWHEAVLTAHKPQTEKDLAPESPARLRLAYDELLAYQVSILLTHHHHQKKVQGSILEGDGCLTHKIRSLLPFSLTSGQESAIADIARDMASPQQMLRLIQGDVGSGKTTVALMAMAQAVEANYQAAILAPTDILARQHMAKLSPLCEAVGIRLALLTGRDQGKKRNQLLEDLSQHQIDILVGTHALIQEGVQFAKLGLSIIDEQHRFGVDQRLALMTKGKNPDVLAMTATPIPRTLQLANYGDMDVSFIRDKPLGRQPIVTKVLPLSRLAEVVEGIHRALNKGTKAYWVCPLVVTSQKVRVNIWLS